MKYLLHQIWLVIIRVRKGVVVCVLQIISACIVIKSVKLVAFLNIIHATIFTNHAKIIKIRNVFVKRCWPHQHATIRILISNFKGGNK